MSILFFPPTNKKLIETIRLGWRQIPLPVRQRFWTLIGGDLRGFYARQMLARPSLEIADPNEPFVIAGLFSTANGIGEAARSTYRSLRSAGVAAIAVDLSEQLASVDLKPDIPCQSMPTAKNGTLLLQLNAPETMAALHHLGMRRDREWRTIGYWAWELPQFPQDWDKAFTFLSEIWTISSFAADAIASHKLAPKTHIFPHAISAPHTRVDRQQFGWSDDCFVFLTMADAMSSMGRKNPFKTITAFNTAFGNDPSRHLVVKTRNLDKWPDARKDLEHAIEGLSNVTLLDAALSEDDKWVMLNSADALISLHRSEGFGLTLAESMALGKPVVTTAWSGNMDYACEQSAYLVDYDLIPCSDVYGVYKQTNTHWAEARLGSAVDQMKKVAEDEATRDQKASYAKQKLNEWASSERIGKLMADHLFPRYR